MSTKKLTDLTNQATAVTSLDLMHVVDVEDTTDSPAGTSKKIQMQHLLTKANVGLSNADNTTDLNKPISTATQTALNTKQSTLATGAVSQYLKGDLTLGTFSTDVDARITAVKAQPNGLASLDVSGKVPSAQLSFTSISPKGVWNALTNTPTLSDATGSNGDLYTVSVAGSQNLGSGVIAFAIGDQVFHNATIWEKQPAGNAVTSFNSRAGAVTPANGDYTATQITNTPAGGIAAITVQDAITELDTEKQIVLISGTNIKTVNGTSILGAGNLTIAAGGSGFIGQWDASGNVFPSTGGTGLAGAIEAGNNWFISVAGILGGVAVTQGDAITSLINSPGQTAANWGVVEKNIGYTAENTANKENTTLDTSTVKYPTNRLTKEYADAKVADAINDGTTTIAPSQNAVFDALVLKLSADGTIPLTGALNEKHGTTIASASTINLETATGNFIDISGTTTITAVTLGDGHRRTAKATGIFTLTHSANLFLEAATNYTTAVNDLIDFIGDAAGVVRVRIRKQDGTAVVSSAASLPYEALFTVIDWELADLFNVSVANQADRFALTAATAPNGTIVKQLDNIAFYIVVDQNNLANSTGYADYARPYVLTITGATHGKTTVTDVKMWSQVTIPYGQGFLSVTVGDVFVKTSNRDVSLYVSNNNLGRFTGKVYIN